jgi:outer membrane receptor protein involved in Fe transport
MNTKPLNRLVLSTAIAAILMSGVAMAQDSGQTQTTAPAAATPAGKRSAAQVAADAKNAQTLQQVVVTGTSAVGGLKKIDASYSITTATAQQIKEANPKSSADLLKLSPGVFPESSGGQTGANIEIAGFPGGGDAPYVTFQLNGSPLYPMSTLSFMENSSMFRLDDTIDRLEAVQGGPAVLYGNGQPGLAANFILKEGTDTPTGDVGVTYGSEGLVRLDGFYGFKIADQWYGSFGGFYRKSDGVRDPQFDADKGGQLTATLTHDFDNGSLMFYARDLKDHNQFVTDTPILNASPGNFSDYPGFSPLTGTFGSNADRREFIQTTPCGTPGCTPGGVNVDLAKGRGADIHLFGGNFDYDFGGGWTISDKFNLTAGQMNTISFFSTGANPSTLSQYIAGQMAADGIPAGVTATANYTTGGAANPNENVTTQGLWYVHKHISAASNEFHLSKELFDGNTLTVGNYTAVYNDHDTWSLGNPMLLQAKNNPKPISVTLSNGDVLVSPQGFAGGQSTAIYEAWNATNTAFFASDSWKVDNWLFDAGIRVEHQDANGRIQNTATGDLDDNPATLYNNNSVYLAQGNSVINYSKSAPSWTIGANYEFTPTLSAYARVNDGVHFPGFDDLRGDPTTPVQKIHNMELGVKYQTDWVYADVSAYRRLFYGVPYTLTTDQGQETLIYSSVTKGVNFQATFKPFEHFTVAVNGDWMEGHYTNSLSCTPFIAQDGSSQCASINNMQLQRQPKFQGRLTPAYDVPTSWGDMRFWVTYEYVGNRFGDLIEQQPLGNYYDISFGATADFQQNWEVSLQGTNMTNQIGITEGNARLFGFAGTNGVILARSIEGREVNFQVKYKF